MKKFSIRGRKKGFGKVQKVTWKDGDIKEDKEDSVNELMDEGVACLRLDDDSDPEEQFVLSIKTCLPDDDACVDDDNSNFHLNY